MLTIGQIPLFEILTPAQRRKLARHIRYIAFPTATILMQEGALGDPVMVIVDGEVEILKALGSDQERLLHLDGPGIVLGEISLFDQYLRRTFELMRKTEQIV